MQWETLKGEAGAVQRFSSCQQISLKEQNAAFSFWGTRDASQIFLPSYIFRTMVFVWGWWIIKVAQSYTYDGVCSLMCRFPSSVWFTCPRGAAGSLCVHTFQRKHVCHCQPCCFFASMWLDCIQMSKLAPAVLRGVQTHNSSSPQQAFRRTFCRLPDGTFRERTSSIHRNIGVTLLDITWIV